MDVRTLSFPDAALKRLARADGLDFNAPDTDSRPFEIAPHRLVGDEGNAISAAIANCLGIGGYGVVSWHLLRPRRSLSKPPLVQDIVADDGSHDSFSILLCASGDGAIVMREAGSVFKSTTHRIQLNHSTAVIYKPNVTYSLAQSTSVYLHCVAAPQNSTPAITIYRAVKFPCPYNDTVLAGDVRQYPSKFTHTGTGACAYRGSTWKNVLDHLPLCTDNTDCEKKAVKREKRRKNNRVTVICPYCNHPPFNNKSSLSKHKSRHHSDTPASASQTSFLPQLQSTSEDDEDDFGWLLGPSDEIPDNRPRKLQRRKSTPISDAPMTCPSLLQQFDKIIAHPPERVVQARAPAELAPHPPARVYALVGSLLGWIVEADVRQPSGRMEHNVGKMIMAGVTTMLDCFGDLACDDVFVDIGAGVGDVVLQIALQSRFTKAIGVEMRPEITALTARILESYRERDQRLSKVVVMTGGITKTDISSVPAMMRATHLFSHNTVFTESAMLAFEELCWLPRLRHIAMTRPPSPGTVLAASNHSTDFGVLTALPKSV